MARSAVLFLLVMLCLTTVITTDDFLQSLKDRNATRYCGPNLSEILSLVCKGRYNAPPPVHEFQKRDTSQKDAFRFPFISKYNTEHFMATYRFRRRFRRGVYNECCENPCSYDVLMSYCA